MSNKSVLFDSLKTFPTSIPNTAFPTLTVPTTPTTPAEAVITGAKADIEIVKWLNTFHGMQVRELYGMVGMLSPAAQAVVGAILKSNGAALPAGTIDSLILLMGDEASGGGLSAQFQLEEDTTEGFSDWLSDVSLWIETVSAAIHTAEDAFAQGIPYTEETLPVFPTPVLPVPINPGIPAHIRIILILAQMIIQGLIGPIIKIIVERILRRIANGGVSDPWLKLFKNFGFLWEGKDDEGLSSMLLLIMDRAIEIYNSKGEVDVFLDNLAKRT